MTINDFQTLKLQKTLRHTIQKLREQKRKLEKKVNSIDAEIKATEELLNKLQGDNNGTM